jgi:plasmid stabilization system protein ParE
VKLIYSGDALQDLVRLRTFISEHDPAAANRIGKDLVVRIEHLGLFPEMGREVGLTPLPGKVRDMIFGRYVVRYALQDEIIVVLRIWHYYEDWK